MTLQHVALETAPRDVGACAAFFALLGFAEVPVPETLRGHATWVQRGSSQIHLMRVDEPVVPRRGHVAVVAEDYDATLARLRAAGFAPEAREEHWGAPRCFVSAPGGHVVEVMAAPPPP